MDDADRRYMGAMVRARGNRWMRSIVNAAKKAGHAQAIVGEQGAKNRAQTWADVDGIHVTTWRGISTRKLQTGSFKVTPGEITEDDHIWLEAKCVDDSGYRPKDFLDQAFADGVKAGRGCFVTAVHLIERKVKLVLVDLRGRWLHPPHVWPAHLPGKLFLDNLVSLLKWIPDGLFLDQDRGAFVMGYTRWLQWIEQGKTGLILPKRDYPS